jgi:CheY-like chemotaxis protein
VDHDESILTILGDMLLLEGYTVRQANAIGEALAVLTAEQVDLIITDTMRAVWDPRLPTVQQLRTVAPNTHIALFTAWSEAGDLDLGKAGLGAVWHKPSDLEAMLEGVKRLLAQTPPHG